MAVVCVPLKRKDETRVMKIDYEDWKILQNFKWYVSVEGYVSRNISKKELLDRRSISIHRSILSASVGYVVDHINGDPLDNRKMNLRACLINENVRNRKLNSDNKSGYKGVSKHRKTGKWQADIRLNNRTKYLGLFASAVEAALAYNSAAKKYHGAFARLNEV